MLGREIRIKLDGGNEQIYYPGATIRGVVTYKASANDRLQSVNIDVRGVTKVLSTKKSPIPTPEHIELFHLGEHLLQEPVFTANKHLKWSFAFQLPTLTAPDRSNQGNFYGTDSHNELFDTLPHNLPPALGADQSDEVKIEYPMYAVAKRSVGFSGPAMEIPESAEVFNIDSLRYCPDPPDIAEPVPTEEKTFALGTGCGKQRRFTLKRSGTNTSINSSQDEGAPAALLVARIPQRIVLGQPIPISFIVGSPSISDTSCPPPKTYSLKSYTATLLAHTHRRTAKCPHAAALTETRSKKLGTDTNRNPVPLCSSPTSYSIPTTTLKDWPPSFRSYSIARTYELVIDATIISGGGKGKERREEEAHFEMEVEAVQSMEYAERERRRGEAPPEFAVNGDGVDSVGEHGRGPEAGVGVEVDALPPPYERHADGRWIGSQWIWTERVH